MTNNVKEIREAADCIGMLSDENTDLRRQLAEARDAALVEAANVCQDVIERPKILALRTTPAPSAPTDDAVRERVARAIWAENGYDYSYDEALRASAEPPHDSETRVTHICLQYVWDLADEAIAAVTNAEGDK